MDLLWIVVLLGIGAPLGLWLLLSRFRSPPGPPPSERRTHVEFVISPAPGEWLKLAPAQYAEALRPAHARSRVVEGWGDHRIRLRAGVADVDVAFLHEGGSVRVCFEGEIEREVARGLAEEIRESLFRVTGQTLVVADA